jgi:hypothetical protein
LINGFHILPSFLVNLFSLQSYQIFLERSITTKKENEPKPTDAQELALGTNPLSADSDGDGRSDLVEVEEGTNPLEKDLQDIDQTSITEPSSVFIQKRNGICSHVVSI